MVSLCTQQGGLKSNDLPARYAADIAAVTTVPKWVLVHMGSNDLNDIATGVPGKEAQFKADMGTAIDAIHAAFPATPVYWARTWRRGYTAEAVVISGWIDDMIAAGRTSWLFVGPNGPVWMENGDNGTTRTVEGVHPNAAGYSVEAGLFKTILGY